MEVNQVSILKGLALYWIIHYTELLLILSVQ